MTPDFQLGDKVRDKITGFVGIVVGKHTWLYGCTTYSVKPQGLDKDGKPQDSVSFDGTALDRVTAEVATNPTPVKTGGPAPFVAPVLR